MKRLWGVSFVVVMACAGSSGVIEAPPAPSVVAAPASDAGAGEDAAGETTGDGGWDGEAGSLAPMGDAMESRADAAVAASACPAGMVLIDGEYCTNLEAVCLKSTYAPQNKKTICWDFKEPTACIGKSPKRLVMSE